MDTIKNIVGSAAIIEYFKSLSNINIDDYSVNPVQYNNFLYLIDFCKELETLYDCEIFRCIYNPKWQNGCVEMLFHEEFAINADIYPRFMRVLKWCNGLNISTSPLNEDWVQITFFVNDIWYL